MKKVDAPSCRLDHNLGKDNNKERMILKLEIFWAQIIEGGKFQKEIEKAEEATEAEVKETIDERREGWRRKGKAILWED